MAAITKTEKETRVYNGSFLPIGLLFLAAVSNGEPKHWCGLQDGRLSEGIHEDGARGGHAARAHSECRFRRWRREARRGLIAWE